MNGDVQNKVELISDVLLWTTYMDGAKADCINFP